MPRTITVKTDVFTFDELDEDAKEVARNWWRDCENQDSSSSEFVIEDAERVADILGIDISRHNVPLMDGSVREAPDIWWSGFWSQGDGACFEGSYAYKKDASKAIREYAPKDKTLHQIADNLRDIQRRYFYQLTANCAHVGRYYHSGCMAVCVDHPEIWSSDLPESVEDTITEALRDFADWIYRQLETEYEYVMSDENVDESIRANEYEFTADGQIF